MGGTVSYLRTSQRHLVCGRQSNHHTHSCRRYSYTQHSQDKDCHCTHQYLHAENGIVHIITSASGPTSAVSQVTSKACFAGTRVTTIGVHAIFILMTRIQLEGALVHI